MRINNLYYTNLNSDSFKIYLNDISKEPVLTKEQEEELFKKYKENGDINAANRLIKSNLKFVVSCAKNLSGNNSYILPDLINEGNIGLMEALERFDYTKGVKFITYAVSYITRAINNYIIKKSNVIRIKSYDRKYYLINKIRKELTDKNHYEPSNEMICDVLLEKYGIKSSPSQIGNVISISIDGSDVGYNDEDETYENYEFNREYSSNNLYEDTIKNDSNKLIIKRLFKYLHKDERDILSMIFGIDTFNNMEVSIEDVAVIKGVSAERIRQIKDNALNKLHKKVASVKF